MELLILIFIFILIIGACIGSFLNVVALRAISGESIVFPSSKCPVCNNPIKWYDNIPILSYLFIFKGKCRNCGCKVSLQYPIVEATVSILFFLIFLYSWFSLQTLCLWFLISIAMVMGITDFKTSEIYDRHLWIYIIASTVYSIFFIYGLNNAQQAFIGIISAVLIMEIISKVGYYLIKHKNKTENEPETEKQNQQNNNENNETETTIESISEYAKKYKRSFGEGDTYIAAGSGALLGWFGFLVSLLCAIVVNALIILPQFLIGLYKRNEKSALISISGFFVLAVIYWILSNRLSMPFYLFIAYLVALCYFAIYAIKSIKNIQPNENSAFFTLPFGPALLISTFAFLFFGKEILTFLNKYIFWM